MVARGRPVDSEERPEPSRYGDAQRNVGRTVAERWTLDGVLGIGGTACVYAARHRNGRQVAVKILHSDLASNVRLRRRFLSEGYAANRVGHPGAVAILDDGVDVDGTVFLVMERLFGQSLAERLEREGPLAPAEVAEVAGEVLDVLAAAHDRGIIHRDVKPSNVFLTTQGDVKLLDFGAARLRDNDDLITASGTTLGTPAFMAPELAAGKVEEVDARSDIWAVGACMFQLLTGKVVHETRSVHEAIVAAATRRVSPIAEIVPELSSELAAVVDRALAFEKRGRWPNARAMRQALSSSLSGSGRRRIVPLTSADTEPDTEAPDVVPLHRHGLLWLTVPVAVAFGIALVSISFARVQRTVPLVTQVDVRGYVRFASAPDAQVTSPRSAPPAAARSSTEPARPRAVRVSATAETPAAPSPPPSRASLDSVLDRRK